MIVRLPEKMPPDARPAIALPMMNEILFGATAQRREPAMKSTVTWMNKDFTLNVWNIFPHVGWSAVAVRKYAAPYHSPSDRAWKSSVIRGLILET